jgi:hypothetical protein
MISYSNSSSENKIIIECQICFEEYDSYNKKPLVLECGHSICQHCIHQLLTGPGRNIKKCPFDNKEIKKSYDQFPVNWAYIDIISSNNKRYINSLAYKKSNRPVNEYQNYKEFRTGDGRYRGQVENKDNFVRNGYGIMEYNDSSIYTGHWKKDKR